MDETPDDAENQAVVSNILIHYIQIFKTELFKLSIYKTLKTVHILKVKKV